MTKQKQLSRKELDPQNEDSGNITTILMKSCSLFDQTILFLEQVFNILENVSLIP